MVDLKPLEVITGNMSNKELFEDQYYFEYAKNINCRVIHTTYDQLYKYIDQDKKVPMYNDNLLLPEDDVEGEEWTQVPGFSKSYVSNFHRFKLDIGNGIYRLLKQDVVYIDGDPYLYVFLHDDVKTTRCLVDRAIYATYVDPEFPIYQYNPEYTIIHANQNTLDNNPENLKAIARNI